MQWLWISEYVTIETYETLNESVRTKLIGIFKREKPFMLIYFMGAIGS